jgi:hypothetical protein
MAGSYSAYVNLSIEIFDEGRARGVKLREAELSIVHDREAVLTDKTKAPCDFTVDGLAVTVPTGTCPRCWEPWDMKSRPPSCMRCGCPLGEGAKLATPLHLD